MKILKKEPGGKFHAKEIENTLEALQAEVGGLIETLTFATDACIVLNEEGKLLGLPYNCDFCGQPLVGPVLIVGIDGDDFASVPDDACAMFLGINYGGCV